MPEQNEQPTFTDLVLWLATMAAVHLGAKESGADAKGQEPDLKTASQMIEMLGVLEQKTKGNLAAEEEQLLRQVLYNLRMGYVAASQQKRIVEP